ncbi:flagellar hook protein FlgE [bacterium]|nr:flagellar hook protein FlgE [bacterium]
MTVLGSMYAGISGLNSNGVAMEIIGNNIANINTPGFKSSRPDFSDILSKTLATGYGIGRGSQLEAVTQLFVQGGFQSTETVTDLAIEGNGFFIVKDATNNGEYYSRAGNFHFDSDGYLTNALGFRVQGFGLDAKGNNIGTLKDVHVSNAPLPPKQTGSGVEPGTGVTINANLSSSADTLPGGPAFDVNDPINTSNFVTSITVYDSLGNGHQISAFFRKTAESATGNSWEWYAVTAGEDHISGVDTICAQGTLEFDTDGALTAETTTSSVFDFAGGPTQGQVIGFDFGESIAEGGTGFSGSTQFGEESALVFQSQDGFAPSYISGIEINDQGIVVGRYANGENIKFAQIGLGRFTTQSRLANVGSNLYQESIQSGPPIIGVASVGGNGRIFSNTLELSNVDIAQQFVAMITTQRGFQANSRSITTSDEMLAELMQIKR